MKKIIILISVTLLLGISVMLFLWSASPNKIDTTNIQNQPFPIGSTTNPVGPKSGYTKIQDSHGAPVTVRDFLQDKETAHDVLNSNHYMIAGSLGYCLGDGTCPSGATVTGFSIDYDKARMSFTILLEEPLRENRLKAEQFLIKRLDVDSTTLCRLNYWIGTTSKINQFYAGQNLDFSFCPGSVQIPE